MVCTDATGYHTVEFVNFKPNVDVPILLDRQLVPIIGIWTSKLIGRTSGLEYRQQSKLRN
jgi:hypothetical protein